MSEGERSVARSEEEFRSSVEKGYPLLREAGETLIRADVPFVDLTQLFAETREPVYRDSCCHLNSTGNRQLARAIADTLSGSPQVASR